MSFLARLAGAERSRHRRASTLPDRAAVVDAAEATASDAAVAAGAIERWVLTEVAGAARQASMLDRLTR